VDEQPPHQRFGFSIVGAVGPTTQTPAGGLFGTVTHVTLGGALSATPSVRLTCSQAQVPLPGRQALGNFLNLWARAIQRPIGLARRGPREMGHVPPKAPIQKAGSRISEGKSDCPALSAPGSVTRTDGCRLTALPAPRDATRWALRREPAGGLPKTGFARALLSRAQGVCANGPPLLRPGRRFCARSSLPPASRPGGVPQSAPSIGPQFRNTSDDEVCAGCQKRKPPNRNTVRLADKLRPGGIIDNPWPAPGRGRLLASYP